MRSNHTTAYLTCIAAALFSFYNFLQFSSFNTLSNALLENYQLSQIDLGLFSSSYLFANALGLLFLGALMDIYSARRIALFAIVIDILACLILASTHVLALAVTMRFMQGLASATSLLLATRMAAQWFPQRAASALGSIIAIALLGGVSGNIISQYSVNLIGWRNTLYLFSVLGGLIFIYAYCYLKTKQYQESSSSFQFSTLLRQLKTTIRYYPNILLGIYLGLMSLPIFVWASLWGKLFLINHYHLSPLLASAINTYLFIGLIIGSACMGYLADSTDKLKLVMYSGTVMTVLAIFLILCHLNINTLQLSLLFFLTGFFSSSQNLAYAIVARSNHEQQLSTATGITAFFLNLVGAISQILFATIV